MNKIYISFLVINLLASNILSAHCQVPCGIYDDASRIILIKENFQTIKKSMDQIEKLSGLRILYLKTKLLDGLLPKSLMSEIQRYNIQIFSDSKNL